MKKNLKIIKYVINNKIIIIKKYKSNNFQERVVKERKRIKRKLENIQNIQFTDALRRVKSNLKLCDFNYQKREIYIWKNNHAITSQRSNQKYLKIGEPIRKKRNNARF